MSVPRHARYGPPDRYGTPPAAGMCISIFAIVKAPGGKTLVGKPADSLAWNDWMPSWRHYEKDELAATFAGWLFPATYLHEGEDPREGVDRIMRGMLGVRSYRVADRPRVFSATAPSDWYPGHLHWDLALLYDVTNAKLPKQPPAMWRELSWKLPRELHANEFNWNEDLALWLKVAKKAPAAKAEAEAKAEAGAKPLAPAAAAKGPKRAKTPKTQ